LWREVGGNIQEKEALRLREERKGMTKDEILEAEIGRLTGEIDTALKLSKDHTARVNDHLDTDSNIARISSTPSISGLDPSLGEADLKEIAPAPSAMGSEGGLKEPPSTPANGENQSSNIARFTATAEAQGSVVGSEKVLDVTLPHNKPNSDAD
jgi:NAD-dependent histone deacetylase SIR2